MWSAGPVRVYLVTLLVWVAGQYVFSIFPLLRFGVFGTIEMVRVAGQYGFLTIPGSVLAGAVRLKWRGCAVISFSFSLVSCHFSWRVDMRGRDIALFFLWYFVVVSCGFHIRVVDC